MSQIFSDILLRKVTPPATGRAEIWDQRIPGFGLRISASGNKTFILLYRHRGRARRLSLGRYPFVSLADAREKATAALTLVSKGDDPTLSVERSDDVSYQFEHVVDDFVERHCKAHNKPKTAQETERLLKRHFVGAWGKRDIRDVTQKHVSNVLDGLMKAGAPSEANHALAVSKKFFSWCVERDLLVTNPSAKLKKPGRQVSRSRVLTVEEIGPVWKSFELIGYPFGHMGKLLLLTGQRRGEVTGMCWSHLDEMEKTWSIPAELTKNSRKHLVPLSDAALSVLKTIPKFKTDRVFPARGNLENAISGFSRMKVRMDSQSGTSGWTLHDLRRTAATGMAELGIGPHVIERILNHVSGSFAGVAGVYNRHPYLAEMRAGLDLWARHVEGNGTVSAK